MFSLRGENIMLDKPKTAVWTGIFNTAILI